MNIFVMHEEFDAFQGVGSSGLESLRGYIIENEGVI
jgi:hypothetical protein